VSRNTQYKKARSMTSLPSNAPESYFFLRVAGWAVALIISRGLRCWLEDVEWLRDRGMQQRVSCGLRRSTYDVLKRTTSNMTAVVEKREEDGGPGVE
jgi:hypothetical protein